MDGFFSPFRVPHVCRGNALPAWLTWVIANVKTVASGCLLCCNFATTFPLCLPMFLFARFEAASAGFKGVEFLFPSYSYACNELKARLTGLDLELVLFNTPPGDIH